LESTLNELAVARAAQALIAGHLVAFPTETVYGLGANAEDSSAVEKIYRAKNRPANHPLIVHASSLDTARHWVRELPAFAEALGAELWPGPMTLVLRRSNLAGDFLTGGQDTVAVRVPAHPVALALLSEFEQLGGRGVAAPSANRFGKVSPTNAAAVHQELDQFLSDRDLILDGGSSMVGIESTIIDCTSELPRVLRLGAVTASMVAKVTGLSLATEGAPIRVSGSHSSHYAPMAKVLLDVHAQPGDGFIALANHPTPEGAVRLAEPKDSAEYARDLYVALRTADLLGLERVVAIEPKGDELSDAIFDRLQRASSNL
jgi:L-threonylcarbamoyladenylate synthase